MATIDLNISIPDRAFNKLYLLNKLGKSNYSSYYEAGHGNILLSSIINKLKPYEVKVIIDLIEELQ